VRVILAILRRALRRHRYEIVTAMAEIARKLGYARGSLYARIDRFKEKYGAWPPLPSLGSRHSSDPRADGGSNSTSTH